jgi:hypothetical protein
MIDIKNWLIKKLGGYTAEEYKAAVLGPTTFTIKSSPFQLQRLSAQVIPPPDPPELVLSIEKEKIADAIFKHMVPLVTYESSHDCFCMEGKNRLKGTFGS